MSFSKQNRMSSYIGLASHLLDATALQHQRYRDFLCSLSLPCTFPRFTTMIAPFTIHRTCLQISPQSCLPFIALSVAPACSSLLSSSCLHFDVSRTCVQFTWRCHRPSLPSRSQLPPVWSSVAPSPCHRSCLPPFLKSTAPSSTSRTSPRYHTLFDSAYLPCLIAPSYHGRAFSLWS